uniref:Variant surface glycoprotein 1125.84 n=1 Tax=Trypanosoma brucei TaxID=5691 RepID=A0A1J0R567_9TRYP|nr:variant surface glycoprotein 1125.84 [Trypanosoma brucei]
MAFSSINKIAHAMFLFSLTPFAAFAAQDNAKEYRDMCAILKLLTQKIPATQSKDSGDKAVAAITPTAKMEAIYANIVLLNLTVAPDTVLAVLSDKAKYKDGKTVKANAEVKDVFTDIDETTIDLMFSQAQKITASAANKDFTQKYGIPIDLETRERLRPTVAALANKAAKFWRRLLALGIEDNELRTQTRKLMLKALYGEAYLTKHGASITADGEAPALDQNEFSWTASASRDGNCKDADGQAGKAGHCLAQDMVCLCVAGHNSNNQYCSRQQTASDDYSGTRATKATALASFNKLAAACGDGQEEKTRELSGPALAQAVAVLTANFGTNWVSQASLGDATGTGSDKSGILGVYSVAGGTKVDCSATTGSPLAGGGKGICINYNALLAGGKGIPWIDTVLEAASNLNKIYQDSVDQMGIVKSAEAVESQIENLLLMRNLLTQASTKDVQQKVKKPTVEELNKCKSAANKTVEGCSAIDCEYDSEKNECRPKKGTETTATGPGERTTPADGKANNTVSDSLLIKTSPLWLAFLLF